MGHADIKTTMIYVSLAKSHIKEQVEKLNGIYTAAGGRQEPNRRGRRGKPYLNSEPENSHSL